MSTALSSYIPVKTCSKGEMKLTDNYVHNWTLNGCDYLLDM